MSDHRDGHPDPEEKQRELQHREHGLAKGITRKHRHRSGPFAWELGTIVKATCPCGMTYIGLNEDCSPTYERCPVLDARHPRARCNHLRDDSSPGGRLRYR